MADAGSVMAGIDRQHGVRYAVLTPNMKGLEAALPTRPDEIVVFGSASEAFSQKNINCSIAESIERFAPVVETARTVGIMARGIISCSVGCPYEGDILPERVGEVASRMKSIGVQRLGIADTIGVGTPRRVRAAFESVMRHFDLEEVFGHFHDTYGQALANTLASLELGVARFETSVAGLGGCPFARGATGNVATEDVLYMLEGLGIETGVNLDRLVDAGAFISATIGRAPASRAATAILCGRTTGPPRDS
jgi:hydroxymethylglutaryl-CoA lyase